MKKADTGLAIFAALFCAQFAFGVFPVIGKIALVSIPPLPFALFRVGGASLLLFVLRRFLPREAIARADWPAILLLSLLGVTVNQIFFIEGLSRSTAINATLLMVTIPVLTLGVALLLRQEEATPRKLAGCVLALAGALVLLGAHRFDWSSRLFVGDVLLLVNATAYSFYLVLSRPILRKYSAALFTNVTFAVGAVPVAVIAAAPLASLRWETVEPRAWLCLGLVIVFPSALAYLLNAWALGRTDASRVALFVTLQPAVATVFAMVLLGERPTGKTALSAGLIVAGLVLAHPRLPRRNP